MESLVHGMLSNAAAVTVLAVVIALAGRLGRRPALVHSLCLLAMLKLVTPPVVSLPLPVPVPVATAWPAASPGTIQPDDDDLPLVPIDAEPVDSLLVPADLDGDWPSDEPAPEESPEAPAQPVAWRWEALALGAVLAGALAWWALAAVRIARFHRLLRDVEPMPAGWQSETAELAGRLGLRRPPMTCLVPGGVPPMLWALGPRVRLLVPARLWATLGDDERTSLLLHELAHLRRRDHWVRWGELAVAGLYWWHPAVWWIRRGLREAEEQCCDAWVVWAMPRGARTYAAALVAALEFVSGARTTPAAAASATLGSGHVSSLKRRLRMIVKARTPKGLSWAGRLAVAGLSALLLPLAPSWGQKDDGSVKKPDAPQGPARTLAEEQYAAVAGRLFETDMRLIEARSALEVARDRFERSRQGDAARLEDKTREEFKKDPDAAPLVEQIKQAREALEQVRRLVKQPSDPAVVAAEKHHKKLLQQWNDLWEQRRDEIKRRLQAAVGETRRPEAWLEQVARLEVSIDQLQKNRAAMREMLAKVELKATDQVEKPKKGDDEPKRAKKGEGEPKKEARSREASERIEKELKELKERLGKDLDPVGDAVRKSLERALDEIQQTLKKEGMTPEDLRRAVEKSRDELHKSLQRGGPVEKQMREAAERVRKDLQELMKSSMREAEGDRESLKSRMQAARELQKKRIEEMAEQHRKASGEHRKALEAARAQHRKAIEERLAMARREAERQRESARDRARQPEEKGDNAAKAERPEPKERPGTGDREKAERREDVESARKEIRELQERLREANRRLEQLQRRQPRRPEPPARPVTPEAPRAAEPAARPATPATPARPAEPRRPGTPARPAEPRRPTPPARPAQPERVRGGDDYERRFRDLEDKMDRLLRELEQIRRQPTSGTRGILSRGG